MGFSTHRGKQQEKRNGLRCARHGGKMGRRRGDCVCGVCVYMADGVKGRGMERVERGWEKEKERRWSACVWAVGDACSAGVRWCCWCCERTALIRKLEGRTPATVAPGGGCGWCCWAGLHYAQGSPANARAFGSIPPRHSSKSQSTSPLCTHYITTPMAASGSAASAVATIHDALSAEQKTTEALAPVVKALEGIAEDKKELLAASTEIWIASRNGGCRSSSRCRHLDRTYADMVWWGATQSHGGFR